MELEVGGDDASVLGVPGRRLTGESLGVDISSASEEISAFMADSALPIAFFSF